MLSKLILLMPTVILPIQPSQSDDTTKLAKPTANSITSDTTQNVSDKRSPISLTLNHLDPSDETIGFIKILGLGG
jgi:hypothetical protein